MTRVLPPSVARPRDALPSVGKAELEAAVRSAPTIARVTVVVAVVGPLMTLPQIYNVWVRGQTAGVSVVTWSLYTACAAIWIAYGASIRDRPLVISNVLWFLLDGAVVLAVVAR